MWATQYIEQLKSGTTSMVKFRPHGNSMQPRIESGQLVTVTAVDIECPHGCALHLPFTAVKVGDIALCKVEGKQWLHLITAIGSDGRFQISNNKGHVNGWCKPENIYGIVTRIEP